MDCRRTGLVLLIGFSLLLNACSDSAKRAELDDQTPAKTSATPPSGTFNASQSVRLDCDDQRGSGCVATYYTLDGSTPSKSAKLYTGPIPIEHSTVLKFFSVDANGNEETIQTATYTFDLQSPQVVQTDPAPDTFNVPLNSAKISITFDEDMDETTLTPENFSVNNRLGGIKGNIVYNADAKTATFSPENPLLPGIQYTVRVNAQVTDAAGNPVTPFQQQFVAASVAWVHLG